MNHFFAIELSPEARQAVAQAAAEWKSRLTPAQRAKWAEPEDYHLTLTFLGDLPVSAEGRLIDITAPIAATTAPFKVQLLSFDAFGSLTWPRVLYVSVQPDERRIMLTKRLHASLTEQGYNLDQRPPRPHVTVARHCWAKDRTPWPGWPVPGERLFPSWQVKQFVLMQTLPPESRANGIKARYNVVHTFPLGTP